jgi:hypothetical protein
VVGAVSPTRIPVTLMSGEPAELELSMASTVAKV